MQETLIIYLSNWRIYNTKIIIYKFKYLSIQLLKLELHKINH